MLRGSINYRPSILLELGFLSNGDESEYFLQPESIRALALVLWESLIENLYSYEGVGNRGGKVLKGNYFSPI